MSRFNNNKYKNKKFKTKKKIVIIINVMNLLDVKQSFQILWIQSRNYAHLTKKNIWSVNRKLSVCFQIQMN